MTCGDTMSPVISIRRASRNGTVQNSSKVLANESIAEKRRSRYDSQATDFEETLFKIFLFFLA